MAYIYILKMGCGIDMATGHLFRIGSIKEKNGILMAMRHNKRTPQSAYGANIDASRTYLNYSLTSNETPEAIALHAKLQMLREGIEKPRKNGVMAVECIFSLPIDRHQLDTKKYFEACYQWVKQIFEGELLSFDVHLDESAPHAHAVILPLINGKMQGDKLKGNRDNIKRLNESFNTSVAMHHNLIRSPLARLNKGDEGRIAKLVLNRLKSDPAMLSDVWPCIRDAIYHDPISFAEMLSIELPQVAPKKSKSFIAIMTSKGRGVNTNPTGKYY